MSDLAEKFKELNDAVKPHNVGSAEHREAVRTLEIFVHANADEMIETLAEIARLRADVARLENAIREFTQSPGRDARVLFAALADTADNKQGEQTCDH